MDRTLCVLEPFDGRIRATIRKPLGLCVLLLCSSCVSHKAHGSIDNVASPATYVIVGPLRLDIGYTSAGEALEVKISNLGNEVVLSSRGPFAPQKIIPMRDNAFLPTDTLKLTPNLSMPRPEIAPKTNLEGELAIPGLTDASVEPSHWCYNNSFRVLGVEQAIVLCIPSRATRSPDPGPG